MFSIVGFLFHAYFHILFFIFILGRAILFVFFQQLSACIWRLIFDITTVCKDGNAFWPHKPRCQMQNKKNPNATQRETESTYTCQNIQKKNRTRRSKCYEFVSVVENLSGKYSSAILVISIIFFFLCAVVNAHKQIVRTDFFPI